jgi:hypothetical protein
MRSHPFPGRRTGTTPRGELEWDLERENDLCIRSARAGSGTATSHPPSAFIGWRKNAVVEPPQDDAGSADESSFGALLRHDLDEKPGGLSGTERHQIADEDRAVRLGLVVKRAPIQRG